ncbi:MAG TPA: hypothetical protein VFD43_03525 [Planctomycetota bacterium]|nr:hypothetical protein [Planctomycetota bacterium]
MSFRWFRKYEKPFLWAAVVVSIGVFVVFSGMGNLRQLIGGDEAGDLAGTFVVQSTGETCEVSIEDFLRTRTLLNKRFYRARGEALTEDDVWQHIMLLADAEGAGVDVAKSEVVRAITGDQPLTREQYRQIWTMFQFSSARELESLERDLLRTRRWQDWSARAASVVDLDDVYVRWKADNERRDLEALVIADRKPEEIPDPSQETVRAWYDEQSEGYRASRYKEDARFDIVYAWAPLDVDAATISDALLADLPPPDPAAVEARFQQLKAERWPELEQPDEAIRAALVRELRVADHVGRALGTFEALSEKSADAFRQTMEVAGLTVADSEGPLGSEELVALPLEDSLLPMWLASRSAGSTYLACALTCRRALSGSRHGW